MQPDINETNLHRHNLEFIGILSLFLLGVLVRMDTHLVTPDLSIYYIPWFRFIRDNGILAFKENFSHYTPLFNYLLALTTLADSIIPKVTAIKIIPLVADFLTSFVIYKVVRIKYPEGNVPFFASGIFLVLPTVFITSAIWGQTDSLYTLFLVLSLFFILKGKSALSMLAFGVAIAFKLQAVFFAPFLLYLLIKKKIDWLHLLIVPSVYVTTCIPILIIGGNFIGALGTYFNQVGKYQWLSGNAPNLYIFIPKDNYQTGLIIGLVIAVFALSSWLVMVYYGRKQFTKEWFVFLALVSVVITPSLLPKMYDRYFYPANVFSLITAFFIPELWFIPIIFQISSGLAYMVYLLGANVIVVKIAAIINLITLGYLLFYQFKPNSFATKEIPSQNNIQTKI